MLHCELNEGQIKNYVHCVAKNILDIFDCNFKHSYQLSLIHI